MEITFSPLFPPTIMLGVNTHVRATDQGTGKKDWSLALHSRINLPTGINKVLLLLFLLLHTNTHRRVPHYCQKHHSALMRIWTVEQGNLDTHTHTHTHTQTHTHMRAHSCPSHYEPAGCDRQARQKRIYGEKLWGGGREGERDRRSGEEGITW